MRKQIMFGSATVMIGCSLMISIHRAGADAHDLQRGIAASAPLGTGPVGTNVQSGPIGDIWSRLRACESDANYAADTGNGYYGAYQFSIASWQEIGESGMPSAATPSVQDTAARILESRQGWTAWPQCSVELGLPPDIPNTQIDTAGISRVTMSWVRHGDISQNLFTTG